LDENQHGNQHPKTPIFRFLQTHDTLKRKIPSIRSTTDTRNRGVNLKKKTIKYNPTGCFIQNPNIKLCGKSYVPQNMFNIIDRPRLQLSGMWYQVMWLIRFKVLEKFAPSIFRVEVEM
jgi:hypothetical protein